MTYALFFLDEAEQLSSLIIEPDDLRVSNRGVLKYPDDYKAPTEASDVDVFDVSGIEEVADIFTFKARYLGRIQLGGPAYQACGHIPANPEQFCEEVKGIVQKLEAMLIKRSSTLP